VNRWEHVGASGKSRFDQGMGYGQRLIVRTASTENHHYVCHEISFSLDLSPKQAYKGM
jgi:hypothetical protein